MPANEEDSTIPAPYPLKEAKELDRLGSYDRHEDDLKAELHSSREEWMIENTMYDDYWLLGERDPETGTQLIYYSFPSRGLDETRMQHANKGLFTIEESLTAEERAVFEENFRKIEAVANVKFIEETAEDHALMGAHGAHLRVIPANLTNYKSEVEDEYTNSDQHTIGLAAKVFFMDKETSLFHNAYEVFIHEPYTGNPDALEQHLAGLRHTALHETMHAMGFNHSHGGDGKPTLPKEWDDIQKTALSYKGDHSISELGLIDIALLQEKYGASEAYLRENGRPMSYSEANGVHQAPAQGIYTYDEVFNPPPVAPTQGLAVKAAEAKSIETDWLTALDKALEAGNPLLNVELPPQQGSSSPFFAPDLAPDSGRKR